jgi:hypothetical protein
MIRSLLLLVPIQFLPLDNYQITFVNSVLLSEPLLSFVVDDATNKEYKMDHPSEFH